MRLMLPSLLPYVAKLLLYLGTAIALGRGALAFLDSTARPAGTASVDDAGLAVISPARASIRSLLLFATAALLLAPPLLMYAQLTALEMRWSEVPMLLRDTTWGLGFTQLAIAAALASVGVLLRDGSTTSLVSVMTALGVATAMGGVGHASADAEWPRLSRLLDAAHVASIGAWIGGLALVSRGAPSLASWGAFSRMAGIMAPIAVISGFGSAARRLIATEGDGVGEVARTIAMSSYGQLLFVKITLAAIVVWYGVRHRERVQAGEVPVRTGVRRELLLAAALFAITAVLTGTAPPGK